MPRYGEFVAEQSSVEELTVERLIFEDLIFEELIFEELIFEEMIVDADPTSRSGHARPPDLNASRMPSPTCVVAPRTLAAAAALTTLPLTLLLTLLATLAAPLGCGSTSSDAARDSAKDTSIDDRMDKSTDAARARSEWHRERLAALAAPEGWLSLVGLDFLEDGRTTFGAGPQCRLRYAGCTSLEADGLGSV